jgi:hypothetical protein
MSHIPNIPAFPDDSIFFTSRAKSSIDTNHGTSVRQHNYRNDDTLTKHHGVRLPSLANHTITIIAYHVFAGTASFLRQFLPLIVHEIYETEAQIKSTIEMQLFGSSAN